MINANEANKESKRIITDFLTTEMNDIEKQIMNAIKEGMFAITNNGHLQSETEKTLESLGYIVATGNQCNELYYTISWY